jgi:phosphoribosylcarboxyaminoimidazole (NCAIR) mutase
VVGVVMGSTSDWDTLRHAAETLEQLGVPHETKVTRAHRTRTCSWSTPSRRSAGGSG